MFLLNFTVCIYYPYSFYPQLVSMNAYESMCPKHYTSLSITTEHYQMSHV